jgi:hypothetical protein
MSWHQVGTKRYYYRSERVNGEPVRRYVGKGQAGEVAAEIVNLRRLEREITARELKAEMDRLRKVEVPLRELCEISEMLTRAALMVAGYHQHARGKWRRRHGNNSTSSS